METYSRAWFNYGRLRQRVCKAIIFRSGSFWRTWSQQWKGFKVLRQSILAAVAVTLFCKLRRHVFTINPLLGKRHKNFLKKAPLSQLSRFQKVLSASQPEVTLNYLAARSRTRRAGKGCWHRTSRWRILHNTWREVDGWWHRWLRKIYRWQSAAERRLNSLRWTAMSCGERKTQKTVSKIPEQIKSRSTSVFSAVYCKIKSHLTSLAGGSASVSERVSICAKHKQRVVSGSIAWEHKNDVVFDAFFMMMVNWFDTCHPSPKRTPPELFFNRN